MKRWKEREERNWEGEEIEMDRRKRQGRRRDTLF